MILAALVSFGILLAAWIAAPTGGVRPEAETPKTDVEVFAAEGIARAA